MFEFMTKVMLQQILYFFKTQKSLLVDDC